MLHANKVGYYDRKTHVKIVLDCPKDILSDKA